MVDKSALFLAQSPLHIYNAQEAIAKFGITRSTFVVVTSRNNGKWAEMMIAALPINTHCLFCERNDFDIEGCTKDYAQHIPWLKKQAFDYVFFSDSRLYIFVDIVNSLQNKNTYLMDDGTGIIQSVNSLQKHGLYFDTTQSSVPERRKEIEKVKKKYKLWQLKAVKYNLFTAFDFETGEQFNVVANPMQKMCYTHRNIDKNKVLFLGQPLKKFANIADQRYLDYIHNIRMFYSGKEVYYLPHPREEEDVLCNLRKRTDLQIIETDLSVEQYLMTLSVTPGTVSGFFSAALWYIAKFQNGIEVDAHRLDISSFALEKSMLMSRSTYLSLSEIVDLIYNYYRLRIRVLNEIS